jgi:hypothetical protein
MPEKQGGPASAHGADRAGLRRGDMVGWRVRAWARSCEADAEAEETYVGAARADSVAAKAVRQVLPELTDMPIEIHVRLLSEPRVWTSVLRKDHDHGDR